MHGLAQPLLAGAEAQRAVERVLALHAKDTLTRCGATTRTTVRHSSDRVEENATIRCSEYLEDHLRVGGVLQHKDAICCWSFHTFEDDVVLERHPQDISRCAYDGQDWPCATVRAITGEDGSS